MAGKKLIRPPFRRLADVPQEVRPLTDWLNFWRQETGQSFMYLSQVLEIDISVISRWINGRVKPTQASRIAQVAQQIGVAPEQVAEYKPIEIREPRRIGGMKRCTKCNIWKDEATSFFTEACRLPKPGKPRRRFSSWCRKCRGQQWRKYYKPRPRSRGLGEKTQAILNVITQHSPAWIRSGMFSEHLGNNHNQTKRLLQLGLVERKEISAKGRSRPTYVYRLVGQQK